jgi:CHAT domain-containing protein/tetratricopeptide (TPR) repeat protein
MSTRLVRVLAFLFACSIFLPHASASVAEPPQPATPAEPSGPMPSAAVQKILDEANRLAHAAQPLDSLKAADQALEGARQENDTAGEAFAQQALGKALKDLQRTKEALGAWHEAQQIWARTGDAPEQIVALTQEGLLCAEDNQSEEERLFVQALAVAKIESPRPAALAQALYDSGYAIGKQGPMPPAIKYFLAALAMREKQSPESVKVVETLNALGKASNHQGFLNADTQSLDLAKGYLTRALEIGQRVAPESSLVVETLSLLGKNDTRTTGTAIERGNDEAAARQHYFAALRIQKKLAPGGSVEEADILEKIGVLELALTDLAIAHEHLAEAAAMAGRFAPNSVALVWSIQDLGLVEKEEGNLSDARDHLQNALALAEKRHIFLGSSFMNLGAVAADQYDFAAARDYLERALAAFTKTIPNSTGVLITLENLASVFHKQGDLASALEYGRRALASAEEKYKDKESGIVAADLLLVGNILRDQGNFSAAAQHYHRALDMNEKLTPGSLYVVDSLGNLAELERARKNTSLAMEYDLRALHVGQKSCPNSWCVAGILNDLGEMAYERGDLASSENYLRQAADTREKGLGPTHPDLARSLNDLALTLAASGRRPEALAMALRAESIGAAHLRVSVRTLSERQALAYETIRASGLDLALTLADRTNTPSARREVFDAMIRSRALVFDELTARHRSAYGSGDPGAAQLAVQLSSARTRLATLVFRGVGDMKPEAYRNLLDGARADKEKAERLLAEKSDAFRQEQARTQLGLKEIAAALPPGSALVAFVGYAKRDLQKRGARKAAPSLVPSYAAFVLRAGKHEPDFVPLGPALELEGLLAAWRSDIARQTEAINVSASAAEDTYRRTGAALRRKIWDPLVAGIGDAREVFVVPDGALHLVSLASLPVGSSQYLVETKPLIHYLSTERDLVPAESRRGQGILVVGNPAFDQVGKLAAASSQQSVPVGAASGTGGALLRGTRSACGTFQTLHFPALPGSQQEAETIAALWKQSSAGEGTQIMRGSAVHQGSGELQEMTGADASPEAFEQYAPGKRVLHVATHGFFLEGSCQSAVERRLDAGTRDETFLPATAENPLLLSGLAFAGANRRGSARADETDGILTAEEIAGINLEGVDWAVLSACDTGVGEIKVGEGVFGLRRAFQMAGAKTVIMSLWQVEDKTTEQWMRSLYREHFLSGKDTGESVRDASLQILRQRRAKRQSTHPFYWGAFIAAGDWH